MDLGCSPRTSWVTLHIQSSYPTASCFSANGPVSMYQKLGHKRSRFVVVGTRDMDFTVAIGHLVDFLQEDVASGYHLILCQGMIRNIGIPAGLWAFVDFEESDCFEHFGMIKSGRPACYLSRLIVDRPLLPRFAKYCTCKSELSRMMRGDRHLTDCRPERRAGRSDRQCSLLHRNRYA